MNKDTIVYKGKWLEMHNVDGYEFMNRYRKPNAVAIFAVTKDKKLIVTEQIRKAIGKPVFELPAGLVDDGETSEQTSARELNEETGYKGKFIKLIKNIAPTPGICTEQIDIAFYINCEKISEGGGLVEENEVIITHLIDVTKDPFSVIDELSTKGIVSLTLTTGIFYAMSLFNDHFEK